MLKSSKLILDDTRQNQYWLPEGTVFKLVGSEWWLALAVHLRSVCFMHVRFQ